MRTALVLLPLSLSLFALSCGPGAAAEAVRPKDPTYAAAMGEGQCHEVEAYGEPLAVDWKPEQRGDLEVLMREGVAVVAYSCKAPLKILKDCKYDGKYGFLGMSKKEQVVRLANSDEVKANLPLGGVGLAAQIGGEMQRGATLDVALVMIGKKRTTVREVAQDELTGECAGATHFVKGATVGAFVMEQGTKAQVKTAAQMFGASASAGSDSSKNVKNTDGDPSDCAKSSPDSATPPSQCQAIVRLELKGIKPKAAKEATNAPTEKAAPPPEPKPQAAIEAVEEPCPKGLVMTEGKCADPKGAAAHLCDPKNGTECVEQCGKGHAGSCASAGSLLAGGGGGLSRDESKARELLGKGCDGGEPKACSNLGLMLTFGRGGGKDMAGAVKQFERACKDADPVGCNHLGMAYKTGEGASKDEAKAASLFRQACDGGSDQACGALGHMLLEGQGVTKDADKAAELLKRACDGSQGSACNELGEIWEGKRNAMLAKMMYFRACIRQDWNGCANQGRLELGQGGNADMAKRAFEQACTFGRNAVACAAIKVLYNPSASYFPDMQMANAATQKCTTGSVKDCAVAGVLNLASGNKPLGTPQIERACMQQDAFACAIKNKK